jgi:probable FeS assembly SUF system protein SufT
MSAREPIILKRDCEVVQIPSGVRSVLPAGTQVTVTQALGGSFTVMTNYGYLARIEGRDADALGKEPPGQAAARPAVVEADGSGPADVEKAVWDQLRTCYDPEIPVNIVDLGLVYHCEATPRPQGGYRVVVKFTLTAPGCGMGEWLKVDMESKIMALPGVAEVEVEVVFDPPWNQSMMSEAARLELGFM